MKGSTLAEALREAELRRVLSSRIDKHVTNDAAEALAIYAWLNKLLPLEESVAILERTDDMQKGFACCSQE